MVINIYSRSINDPDHLIPNGQGLAADKISMGGEVRDGIAASLDLTAGGDAFGISKQDDFCNHKNQRIVKMPRVANPS
ncbi:hypothetical protein BTA35_0215965 [Oceanospirillum linum]|uniref:Uncharacterized protein n=1 Tax=Oceanospirillum linum TaxID=966 RepID=A0A1T1H7Z2_OCELI|nr:hypothetical protein BTA35_0215965 [Oceanospirillum linum]